MHALIFSSSAQPYIVMFSRLANISVDSAVLGENVVARTPGLNIGDLQPMQQVAHLAKNLIRLLKFWNSNLEF